MNVQVRILGTHTQNIHYSSTRSHASEEENRTRNRSENCKCKRQRCQPWDFIPRSWDFLKRLGYFWDFILRNETLGFFLGFLRNSQEK